jgi:hypothetical protein
MAFLQQTLCMKGFDPKCCSWIKDFGQGGSVGIQVNDYIGHYFKTRES